MFYLFIYFILDLLMALNAVQAIKLILLIFNYSLLGILDLDNRTLKKILLYHNVMTQSHCTTIPNYCHDCVTGSAGNVIFFPLSTSVSLIVTFMEEMKIAKSDD